MAWALALLAAAGGGATPAEWNRMTSLVGSWKGTAEGKPVAVRYQLVSNGTALMETLDGDHDTTMITIYAPDGASLLATHYCAAGNQPLMRATGSPDGRSLAFEFVDVSGQGTEVMRKLVVTFRGRRSLPADVDLARRGRRGARERVRVRAGEVRRAPLTPTLSRREREP